MIGFFVNIGAKLKLCHILYIYMVLIQYEYLVKNKTFPNRIGLPHSLHLYGFSPV